MGGAVSPDLGALGSLLRERRKALGLTQEQLAQRLGWNQERISILESGKYGLPSLPVLAHLARFLDLPLGHLMEAAGFPLPETETSDILLYTLQRLLTIQATSLADTMNQASDLLAQAMGADKIDIFLYERETETLVALGTSNTAMGRHEHATGLHRLPVANAGREVQVFTAGEEYYTGHAENDPEMVRGVVEVLGVRSLFAVPLHMNGQVRGVLLAASARPDHFSPAERDFFRTAAAWVALVGQRVELQEQMTQRTVADARRQVAEDMLAGVAHDLGNAITPIKGRIDLLQRAASRANDEQRAVELGRISRSLLRLGTMVHDLLDASRLEGGLFSVFPQRVDLVPLIQAVVNEVEPDRPEIVTRLPSSLFVEADAARISQALHNLVGNAVQHTPAGTPIIVFAAEEARNDGCWAVIEVHDEGPGMDPDLVPHFLRETTRDGLETGNGLGLYLAHGIAVAHGGTLTVESQPGSGTTFTLNLPITHT